MVLDKRVGFLGAGQMAEALARGFLSKKVVTHINVSDPSADRKELFRTFGCTPCSSNAEVRSEELVRETFLIILGKPELGVGVLGADSKLPTLSSSHSGRCQLRYRILSRQARLYSQGES